MQVRSFDEAIKVTVQKYNYGEKQIKQVYEALENGNFNVITNDCGARNINYYNALNECRTGNVDGFIRFFLQCVVDQCTRNIGRIEKINRVYDEDENTIKQNINGSIVLKMHPIMMKKIVFTAQEMADELGVHINSINIILNKMSDLNIVVKEKKKGTNRVTYRYIRIYETFVEQI